MSDSDIKQAERLARQLSIDLHNIPAEDQLDFVKERIATFPNRIQPLAEQLVAAMLTHKNAAVQMEKDQHPALWERIAIFTFGVSFIILMIVIAIFIPQPSNFQYLVFRIALALSAAGVAALIPGFINVAYRNYIRAGGALGVFVVVYFWNPATLVAAG